MSDSQTNSESIVALNDEELHHARAYMADAQPDLGKPGKNDVLHILIKAGWNDVVRDWMDRWVAVSIQRHNVYVC